MCGSRIRFIVIIQEKLCRSRSEIHTHTRYHLSASYHIHPAGFPITSFWFNPVFYDILVENSFDSEDSYCFRRNITKFFNCPHVHHFCIWLFRGGNHWLQSVPTIPLPFPKNFMCSSIEKMSIHFHSRPNTIYFHNFHSIPLGTVNILSHTPEEGRGAQQNLTGLTNFDHIQPFFWDGGTGWVENLMK